MQSTHQHCLQLHTRRRRDEYHVSFVFYEFSLRISNYTVVEEEAVVYFMWPEDFTTSETVCAWQQVRRFAVHGGLLCSSLTRVRYLQQVLLTQSGS